jgi:hypothetical protein
MKPHELSDEQIEQAVESLTVELEKLLNKQPGKVVFTALTMCMANALICAPVSERHVMVRRLTAVLTEVAKKGRAA